MYNVYKLLVWFWIYFFKCSCMKSCNAFKYRHANSSQDYCSDTLLQMKSCIFNHMPKKEGSVCFLYFLITTKYDVFLSETRHWLSFQTNWPKRPIPEVSPPNCLLVPLEPARAGCILKTANPATLDGDSLCNIESFNWIY